MNLPIKQQASQISQEDILHTGSIKGAEKLNLKIELFFTCKEQSIISLILTLHIVSFPPTV